MFKTNLGVQGVQLGVFKDVNVKVLFSSLSKLKRRCTYFCFVFATFVSVRPGLGPLRHAVACELAGHAQKARAAPQCARTDLNKRFLPKPMTTTG